MNHGPELTEPPACTECDGYGTDHDPACILLAEPPASTDERNR